MTNAVAIKSESQLDSLQPEAQQLLALGELKRWDGVQVLGFAPVPDRPVYLGEWMITPAELDSSPLPERAMSRIQSVYAAGIRPKRWVLVHETPKLLAAPKKPRRKTWTEVKAHLAEAGEMAKVAAEKAAPIAWQVTKVVAVTAGAVAVVCSAGTLLMVALAVSAIMADPILIAVTDDDCWIEIDRWDVE